MTDSIADLMIRIKNGYMARKMIIDVPYSRMKKEISDVLLKAGYLAKIEIKNPKDISKKSLSLHLLYIDKEPKIQEVQIVSKKSRKVYVRKNRIPTVLGGLGVSVLSTSKGIMLDKQARKMNLGGELICKIW